MATTHEQISTAQLNVIYAGLIPQRLNAGSRREQEMLAAIQSAIRVELNRRGAV